MNILAIESSCDETASAVVKDGRFILSNVISSQIDLHAKYGGVVPELASRKHIEVIDHIIDSALAEASLTFDNIDCIAVTYGPGLVGALLVGLAEAKALSYALNKPLIGVHHIQGHIAANYIQNPSLQPPFIALVASGGHTHLVHVEDYTKFTILGRTQDDAAGEAYDKVARVLGLGYPGGPKIDLLAKSGNPDAIKFPRAFSEAGNYNFSFSGLKSAVLNYVNSCRMTKTEFDSADIAASFQQAVVDVLVSKTIHATVAAGVKSIALAGGVASNSALRLAMTNAADNHGLSLTIPSHILCTDNAAMIASAAYYEFLSGRRDGLDLNAVPSLALA